MTLLAAANGEFVSVPGSKIESAGLANKSLALPQVQVAQAHRVLLGFGGLIVFQVVN
jgi:hypothetical protein